MSAWITTHHELCHGDECDTWDCAMLPENIGQFREGEVIEVRDGGREVDIEWSDGTKSTLKRRPKPVADAWLADLNKNGKCGDDMCVCATLTKKNGEWTQ